MGGQYSPRVRERAEHHVPPTAEMLVCGPRIPPTPSGPWHVG
jgi:hypothetical protein